MKHLLILFYLLFYVFGFAQEPPSYSVYLIGDAGEDTIPGKALLLLEKQLNQDPNSAVVFLGDNVYPNGLHVKDTFSKMRLESQLQILKKYQGQVYFIPGNHDWDAQRRNGQSVLKNEEVYVENYLKSKTNVSNKDNAVFLPKDALPGPVSLMLNNSLRLIIIDTQWFLHGHKKNFIGSKHKTKELFYAQLDSLLAIAKVNQEKVIIAGHHPIYSNGQHAKTKQPLRFLVNYTPLKVFGLLGVDRLFSQDLQQPRYKEMRKRLLEGINKYDNLIYVSGHDHNLQCFKEGKNRFIVSGSGSKHSNFLGRNKYEAIFQDDKKNGFIRIKFSGEGADSTTIFREGEAEFILKGY